MFIYCGYQSIESAEFIIFMTSIQKAPMPSAGYATLELAQENYPEEYSIIRIQLTENAVLSDEYPSNDIWKVYRESDVISIEIL
jgi:hypothetical protein